MISARGSVFVLLLLTLGTMVGQSKGSLQTVQKQASEKRLSVLLESISALPPEYKADLAFTLLDSTSSRLSPVRTRTLLDDVFQSSRHARYPYLSVDAAHHPDGVASQEEQSIRFSRSDGLDIQVRVVDHALPSMPRLATHFFEELRLGEVRAACKDATVVDVSAYYNTLAKLIEDKRVTTIVNQQKRLYVQTSASSMTFPSQLSGFAKMIGEVSLSHNDLEQVSTAYVSSLRTITASDREMTAAEEREQLTDAIESLSAQLSKSGISVEPLLAAYRGFLLRSLTKEACVDHSLDRAEVARRFNGLVHSKAPAPSGVPLLSDRDLLPRETGDAARYDMISLNKQLLPQLQRIGVAHNARLAEEYRLGQAGTIEPEYSDVEDVLKFTVSLEPKDASCPLCDFYSKGVLFVMLVDLLPSGQQLQQAIDAETDFLSFHSMETEDPPAFLLLLKRLINVSRKPTDKGLAALIEAEKKGMQPAATPNPEALAIRSSLNRSSDPIIAAYMYADDLLRLPYEPNLPHKPNS